MTPRYKVHTYVHTIQAKQHLHLPARHEFTTEEWDRIRGLTALLSSRHIFLADQSILIVSLSLQSMSRVPSVPCDGLTAAAPHPPAVASRGLSLSDVAP